MLRKKCKHTWSGVNTRLGVSTSYEPGKYPLSHSTFLRAIQIRLSKRNFQEYSADGANAIITDAVRLTGVTASARISGFYRVRIKGARSMYIDLRPGPQRLSKLACRGFVSLVTVLGE